LKTTRAIGDKWLVTEGLAAGDRLIVEGLQNVTPDAQGACGSGIARRNRRDRPDAHFAVLHRPAGLRLGDRDRDRAGGRARDLHLADHAISHASRRRP
jgi:hypothetical protein